MPRVTIDGRCVEVPPGSTLLQAAQQAGVAIPTLCHLAGQPPATSCMVCVVAVEGRAGLVPSCAARAEEGMIVSASSPEVVSARRSAVELLLGDHAGDCEAPCRLACPAGIDIPGMIRLVAAGDARGALEVVRRCTPLPAVLGRICPAPCEKVCRRGRADQPLAICLLKRFVGDTGLAAGGGRLPRAARSGKRVAVVGAGPAGLSAAWRLVALGVDCEVLDERPAPGGMLRYGVGEARLPHDVLAGEIDRIAAAGVRFRPHTRVGGPGVSLEALRGEFDAVLLAIGPPGQQEAKWLGAAGPAGAVAIDRETCMTPLEGVFAAGAAVRAGAKMAARAAGDGTRAADAIVRWLVGPGTAADPTPFNSRLGALREGELKQFLAGTARSERVRPTIGGALGEREARLEASRCMHCDCRAAGECGLRRHATSLGARPSRQADTRRDVAIIREHPRLIHEPAKCIRCGLCVGISARAGESPGLAFIGRGYDVRVGVPLGGSLAAISRDTAMACAAACPTAALTAR